MPLNSVGKLLISPFLIQVARELIPPSSLQQDLASLREEYHQKRVRFANINNMSEPQAGRSRDAHLKPEPETPIPPITLGRPFPSSPLLPYHHHESLQNQEDFQAQIADRRISNINTDPRVEPPGLVHSPRDIKRLVGPWNLGATLGTGSTGRVRKARHVQTGQIAAVKIMSKTEAASMRSTSVMQMDTKLAPGTRQAEGNFLPFGLEREIVIMKLIDHPNIVKLYDLWENRGEM